MKSLEGEKPHGRLDVLAYKVSQRVIEELEAYWQTPGLWDMCRGHVEDAIVDVKLGKVPEPILEVFKKLIEVGKGKV